ncbi:hypothetical protein GGP66_002874 [Salinibacter ruber]|jgi:hypothetical protein|nr:hypothetical protein [Salinibacter ruber]
MNSQAKSEGAPEENAPRRFSTSNFYRFLVLSVAATGLVTIGSEWISDVNEKLAEGSEIATDAVLLGLLAYASFAVFQRSVVVGTEEIWKVRPLWWDKSVQISAIRRVHVPTIASGLWLYTDPDRNPALKIGAGLEDPAGPQGAGDRERAAGGKDHRSRAGGARVLSSGVLRTRRDSAAELKIRGFLRRSACCVPNQEVSGPRPRLVCSGRQKAMTKSHRV